MYLSPRSTDGCANGLALDCRLTRVSEDSTKHSADDVANGTDPMQGLLDAMDLALADLDAAWQTIGEQTGLAGPSSGLNGELHALAARSAINRTDDVHALLRAGTGATVTGAIARSLVEQACVTRWLAEPGRDLARAASLGQERRRLVDLMASRELSVPNMQRWLRPGNSMFDLSVVAGPGLPDLQQDLGRRAARFVESTTGMPAAVADLLAMCGHANAAAAMCTVAPAPHPIGFEATPAYGAIFAQAALTSGAFALGRSTVSGNVRSTVNLARAIHQLPPPPPSATAVAVEVTGSIKNTLTGGIEYLPPSPYHDALLDQVFDRAHVVRELLTQAPNPYASNASKVIKLTIALPYLTALGTTEVALRAAAGEMSGATAATAARMLLEEAGRLSWQGSASDDKALWQRYVAIADAATQGRSLLLNRLIAAGTSDEAITTLFVPLPQAGSLAIDTRRTPANMKAPKTPRPFEQLGRLGRDFTEEGWLDLAYSLLSQVVHATPLGDMHLAGRERQDNMWTLSHEMTALAVDCACLGAATVLPQLAAALDLQLDLSGHHEWGMELRRAALAVHNAAQPLHFLD